MSALARFQDNFSRALLAPPGQPADALASLVAQPGFAVYRNTVRKGCIDALAANYPSVARLVGEEWVRAAAAVYIHAHPPGDPRLLQLGSDFADFLSAFEPAAELPYLSGVARLDRFWTEAHTARDESPLEASALSGLAPERLADAVLRPHPAARWAWFADMPIYSIWNRNRQDRDEQDEVVWRGEGALLTRPRGAVQWIALDAAGCAFLDTCAAGHGMAAAASAAIEAHPRAELAPLLARLLTAGAFASLSEPATDIPATRFE